jgi:hypothetical protein
MTVMGRPPKKGAKERQKERAPPGKASKSQRRELGEFSTPHFSKLLGGLLFCLVLSFHPRFVVANGAKTRRSK